MKGQLVDTELYIFQNHFVGFRVCEFGGRREVDLDTGPPASPGLGEVTGGCNQGSFIPAGAAVGSGVGRRGDAASEVYWDGRLEQRLRVDNGQPLHCLRPAEASTLPANSPSRSHAAIPGYSVHSC